jgi:hypothetical protein
MLPLDLIHCDLWDRHQLKIIGIMPKFWMIFLDFQGYILGIQNLISVMFDPRYKDEATQIPLKLILRIIFIYAIYLRSKRSTSEGNTTQSDKDKVFHFRGINVEEQLRSQQFTSENKVSRSEFSS